MHKHRVHKWQMLKCRMYKCTNANANAKLSNAKCSNTQMLNAQMPAQCYYYVVFSNAKMPKCQNSCPPGKDRMIQKYTRVINMKKAVQHYEGSYNPPGPGVIRFQLDNSFSRFRKKEVGVWVLEQLPFFIYLCI